MRKSFSEKGFLKDGFLLIQKEDGDYFTTMEHEYEEWSGDVVITKKEIEELTATELDYTCHNDEIKDYKKEIDFYLSNALKETYIDYIKECLDDRLINDKTASEIQRLVIANIITKYENSN